MATPKWLRQDRTGYEFVLLRKPNVVRPNPQLAPASGILDEPCYCLKINEFWLPHLLQALGALAELDSWLGDDLEQYRALNEIERFKAQLSDPMACTTIFRQNPANDCQMQYSIDGGDNWTLAFDYSLCTPTATQILIEKTYQDVFNTWNETTNNTEININAPITTFISSPGETQEKIDAREQALCAAMGLYVDAFCDLMLESFDNPLSAAKVTTAAIGLAGAVVGVITFASGGSALPVFLALGGALSSLGISILSGITEAVLGDSGARGEVTCCLYTSIANLAPTEANFKLAANSCSGLSPNAEAIRGAIAQALNEPTSLSDQFHAFINLLGETTPYAELGLVPECPCEEPADPTWCVYADFKLGNYGFSVLNFGGNTYGAYAANIGFQGTNVNESGVHQKRVYIQSPTFDERVVTGVDVLMDYTEGTTTSAFSWALAANTATNESPDYTAPAKTFDTIASGNDQTIEIDYPDPLRTQVRVDARASRMTTTPPNGSVTIEGLRIRGQGVKPSQLAGIPDCDEWCWVWDFVSSENGNDWQLEQGAWAGGYNATFDDRPPLYQNNVVVNLDIDNNITIKNISLTYDLQKGGFESGGPNTLVFVLYNNATQNWVHRKASNQLSNGVNLIETVGLNVGNSNRLVVGLGSSDSSTNPIPTPGSAKLKQIKIRYSGNEIWQNGSPC